MKPINYNKNIVNLYKKELENYIINIKNINLGEFLYNLYTKFCIPYSINLKNNIIILQILIYLLIIMI